MVEHIVGCVYLCVSECYALRMCLCVCFLCVCVCVCVAYVVYDKITCARGLCACVCSLSV